MISFPRGYIALITGASSGIGRAVALLLNSLGATVIANGRDPERLEEARQAAGRPEAFHLEPLDLVEKIDDLPVWVKDLRVKYGKLSGLVPCAGQGLVQPFREYSRQTADVFFNMHVHGPLLLARGFADRRNNTGRGAAIVFMSSFAAIGCPAGLAIYAAAKAAIIAAGKVLSNELAGQGIRVNSIAPGLVDTPLGTGFLNSLAEGARAAELSKYPRGLGRPEDVAYMTAFLLSDKSPWVSRQTIMMDGGSYLCPERS